MKLSWVSYDDFYFHSYITTWAIFSFDLIPYWSYVIKLTFTELHKIEKGRAYMSVIQIS
jgi:hypothetical protein